MSQKRPPDFFFQNSLERRTPPKQGNKQQKRKAQVKAGVSCGTDKKDCFITQIPLKNKNKHKG